MIALSVSFASQGSPWQQKPAFVSNGGVYSVQLPIAAVKNVNSVEMFCLERKTVNSLHPSTRTVNLSEIQTGMEEPWDF